MSINNAMEKVLAFGENNFILQTYFVFSFYLVAIMVIGILSYIILPRALYFPLFLANMGLWIACGWFGWRDPIRTVFPIFAVITGLFLGSLAHGHGSTFAASCVISLCAFGGLSYYAHRAQRNFDFLQGLLNSGFFILLGASVVLIFFPVKFLSVLLAGFGILVFVGWILYDTAQMQSRASYDYTPEHAAFDLIMDLTALRSWIQNLLNKFD